MVISDWYFLVYESLCLPNFAQIGQPVNKGLISEFGKVLSINVFILCLLPCKYRDNNVLVMCL